MAKILIILTFLAVSSQVLGDSSEEVNVNDIQQKFNKTAIKGFFKESEIGQKVSSKIEEFCAGSVSKLEFALDSTVTCISEIDESLTVCAGIRTQLPKCTKQLVKVIDDCMPSSAKGVPGLIQSSIIAAFNHACSMTGEQIFELVNDCMEPDEENKEEIEKCKESLATKIEALETGPSTEKICSLANDFKPFWKSYVKTSCPNQMTRETWNGMLEAIISPCSASA